MIWLAALAALLLATWALRRQWPRADAWLRTLTDPAAEPPEVGRAEEWSWLAGGLLFLVLAFSLLEIRQPYYFAQDDALVAELPGMKYGCEQIWSGEFPEYNPYNSMGAALASAGGGSFTYPPTLLAYAIARHVLGDPFALMDVFAALHLLAGFLLTYLAGRRFGCTPAIATVAALSFVLSGSVLIMGRSWHMVVPVVVFLPLLMLSIQCLAKGTASWGWALWTGLAIGVYYQVGFPQLWVYALVFFCLGVAWLVLARRIPIRRSLWSIPALIIGLGLASPLLFVQMDLARDIARPDSYGRGIFLGLKALFLPYPLVRALHPNYWGSTDIQYMGHFYYFGTVMLIAFLLGILALVTARPLSMRGDFSVLGLLGAVALLLALGTRGGIWFLISKLPFMSIMNNHPFRALPFFVFFSVLGGGLVLMKVLPGGSRRRTAQALLTLVALPLLLYHVTLARPSYYSYAFRPFPPLPEALSTFLRCGSLEGRVMSISPSRSVDPTFWIGMPLDLPLTYRVPSFTGYDPLTESKPPYRKAVSILRESTPDALRAYGIRWILKHRTVDTPVLSPNPIERGMETLVTLRPILAFLPNLPVRRHLVLPEVEAWELDDIAPLAFRSKSPQKPLPIKIRGSGMDVQVPPAGPDAVVVNFLFYPQIRATLRGHPVPCGADGWGRILVQVDGEGGQLSLRFAPRWGLGLWNGGMLVLLGLAVALWLRIKAQKARALTNPGEKE